MTECFDIIQFLLQGLMYFVGRVGISSTKIKRNSIPSVIAGLPDHSFAYVVFGDFYIEQNTTAYTICGRFDNG